MMLTRRTFALTAGAAALAPALLPAAAKAADGMEPPRGLHGIKRRKDMLDITFRSETGEVPFSDLKGKPTVLVFWATWCVICRGEMPKLNALKPQLGDDAHLITLSVDREGFAKVNPYFERNDFDALTPYVDQAGVLAEMMGVRGVPTAFIIDGAGKVAAVGSGRIAWDDSAMPAYIASLA